MEKGIKKESILINLIIYKLQQKLRKFSKDASLYNKFDKK